MKYTQSSEHKKGTTPIYSSVSKKNQLGHHIIYIELEN